MAVVAEAENSGLRTKLPLGGWRNILTGLIYHNACTQTHDGRKSRITQTVAVADAVTGAVHDRAVQVEFLPDTLDRIIVPSRSSFETTETIKETGPSSHLDDSRILNGVVKIQRCYRAYRARTAVGTHALEGNDVLRYNATNVSEHARQSQSLSLYSNTDFVIVNRRSPQTNSDFESLYNLLDRWRILETERAGRTPLGTPRVAACGVILSKEVKLLRSISALKNAVRFRCKERKRCRFLDELSRSVVWQDSRGRPIQTDTLRVQRARQYRDMYTSLADEDLPVLDRINLLHSVKRIADMHTCDQSRELIYLIIQELNLLMCDIDTSRLNWLRNRLRLSFLKLARNALQGDLEEDVYRYGWSDTSITRLCRTCGRLLPLEQFPRERRLRSSFCLYCISVRIRRDPRVVYEPYERMLLEIRRDEAKLGCYSSLAFVTGIKVICRLVNEIWHGKSGIFECDNLDDLRLVRFRRELEWAPWNSLLLTRNEAARYYDVDDIESFYDTKLLYKFCLKNLQAKMHFQSLFQARGNTMTSFSIDN